MKGGRVRVTVGFREAPAYKNLEKNTCGPVHNIRGIVSSCIRNFHANTGAPI